jgi:C_GCAxxG_C_C family probable redox protein
MNNMDGQETAQTLFQTGFSCSQSVLAAFAEKFGLEQQAALKVAGAFGGGMARSGATCGAVSGALMVIGLRYGSVSAEDKAAKDYTYAIGQEFLRRFKALHGETTCSGLLGYHIGTPEGMQQAREQGLFKERCPIFVRDAAMILDEML